MHLSPFRTRFWPLSGPGSNRAAAAAADALVRDHGSAALAVAEDRSAREDIGLLANPRPGHWGRVALEIARRSGRPALAPLADHAA